MNRPVFISYASPNQVRAEEVTAFLEARGWPCWVAPRNVQAGRDYGEQIITAIESAELVILLLTGDANVSAFVKNEVERAFSKKKAIITFRAEDVPPSRSLELFVGSAHWIEAWNPPWDHKLEILARTVSEFVKPSPLVKPIESPRPTSELPVPCSGSTSFVVLERSGTRHELSELSINYPDCGPCREKKPRQQNLWVNSGSGRCPS